MMEEVDTSHAQYLIQTIRTKGRILRPFSEKSWAKVFAQLRKETGSAKRIRKVLEWHRKNYKDKYTPIVRSAKSFREKFINLEVGMERSPVVGKISKRTKAIYRSLEDLHWPKGSKSDLLRVIQISCDLIIGFYHDLLDAYDKTRDDWTSNRIERVMDEMVDPVPFVIRWMKEVNERITHVADWKGKLENFAFRIDHPIFVGMGRTWMNDYSGNPKDWDKLMRKL